MKDDVTEFYPKKVQEPLYQVVNVALGEAILLQIA